MGVQHKFKNPQTLREYLYNLTVDKLRTFEPFIPAKMPNRKSERIETIYQAMMVRFSGEIW